MSAPWWSFWCVVTLAACALRVDLSRDATVGDRDDRGDGGASCARDDTASCDAGAVAPRCPLGVTPAVERCNFVDDDCDGLVDEGWVYQVIDGRLSAQQQLQTTAPTGTPGFVSTRTGVILLTSEGVGAGDCTDTMRSIQFDARGAWDASPPPLRNLPAVEFGILVARTRDGITSVIATSRDYVQGGCDPPIAWRECAPISFELTRAAMRVRARAPGRGCYGAGVATPDAAVFLRATSATDAGRPVDYDLFALDDDVNTAWEQRGALRGVSGSVRGVWVGGRIHWFWASGATMFHRTTSAHGDDLALFPEVALRAPATAVEEASVLADRVYVRVGTRDGVLLVEYDDAGRFVAQDLLQLPVGASVAPSHDGRQVFACSTVFGVSFTRLARDGTPMQHVISVGEGTSTGNCAVTAVDDGALVAWASGDSGSARWLRVGCSGAPQ